MTSILLFITMLFKGSHFINVATKAGLESRMLYYATSLLDMAITMLLTGLAIWCLVECFFRQTGDNYQKNRFVFLTSALSALTLLALFYFFIDPYYSFGNRDKSDMIYRYTSGGTAALLVASVTLAKHMHRFWLKAVIWSISFATCLFSLFFLYNMYSIGVKNFRTLEHLAVQYNEETAWRIITESEIYNTLSTKDSFQNLQAMETNFGFNSEKDFIISDPFLLVVAFDKNYVSSGEKWTNRPPWIKNPDQYKFIDKDLRNFRTLVMANIYTLDYRSNQYMVYKNGTGRSETRYWPLNLVNIYFYDLETKQFIGGKTLCVGNLSLSTSWPEQCVKTGESSELFIVYDVVNQHLPKDKQIRLINH